MKAKEKTYDASFNEQKDLIILGAELKGSSDMLSYLKKSFSDLDNTSTVTDTGNGYYVVCNNRKMIFDYNLNEFKVNEGTDDDWTYTEDSNGNLTLIACKNLHDGIITIPNFINDKPVKVLYNNVFFNNTDLLEVEISYGIEEIRQYAFKSCTNLTNIKFPTSITELGMQAFYGCSQMKGDISNLIPNLNSINNSIFWGCSNLTGDVKIKNGIEVISSEAFRGCSSLDGELYIPSTVTSIENSAFLHCENLNGDLTNVVKNLNSITTNMFFGCKKLSGSIIIKEGVDTIYQNAFKECTSLDGTLVLPKSLKTICSSAFENCRGLNGSIIFGNNITNIQSYAFSNCNQISSIKYIGSETDWNQITIEQNNEILYQLEIEFNYNI